MLEPVEEHLRFPLHVRVRTDILYAVDQNSISQRIRAEAVLRI